MSVSIITAPTIFSTFYSFQSANNDAIYTVASPLSGSTSYLYVADVLNVSSQKVVTLKTYPDPTYGYGVFNMKSIANKFVSYDFVGSSADEGNGLFHEAPNSFMYLQLRFREQYMSGSTFNAPTGTTNSLFTGYANSALSFKESIQVSNLNGYFMSSSHAGKFLQSLPAISNSFTKDAPKTLRQWLYFINVVGGTMYAHIRTQNSAGTELGHYAVANPFNTNTGIKYISIGYPQLAALPTSGYTVVSGASVMIGGSVASYTLALSYSATLDSSPVSEVVKFTVKDECTKFQDTYSLYWLNAFGGFDSMRFALKNVTTYSKNQTPYKKIQGKLNSDGSYTRNSYDPSTVNFYTEISTAIQLNSDWVSDSQVTNLKHLFSSPAIFIEDNEGIVQAATLTNKDYVLNRRVNGSKAFSLQINLQLSSISNRQAL